MKMTRGKSGRGMLMDEWDHSLVYIMDAKNTRDVPLFG